MKSFLLFTLISIGSPALAGSPSECSKAKRIAPEECNKAGVKAAQEESAEAAKAMGCGSNINKCAEEFSGVGSGGINAYAAALGRCDNMKSTCEDACKPSGSETAKEKSQMKKDKDSCFKQIEDSKKEIAKGVKQSKTSKEGGDKTDEKSKDDKSSSAPPAGAPPAPPKSDDDKKDEKTDATQQPAAQQPAAEQKKQEEDKKGKAGLDDAKDQSTSGACSGGKFMCAGCPGFIAKCPGGNAQSCMAKWSDGDRKNYQASCGGGEGSSTQALTNPKTPQSLTGASPQSMGGAGGGGAGSTVSGGNNTSAMLDDGKKNAAEDRAGHKEGGSMGVESAGGGGGGGGDSFGSNPFGDDGSSSHGGLGGLAGMKGMSSSLANAFNASQNSRSGVIDRTGPNLFSIQEAVFQERCNRNLLFHCPNKK